MSGDERAEVREAFGEAVNMAPKELERWLATERSREVGWKGGDGDESVGHEMGRHIVEIKRTKQADLTEEQYAQMRKVTGYVHRHLAQGGPDGDVEDSRWRASLMNWGHDPLKQA